MITSPPGDPYFSPVHTTSEPQYIGPDSIRFFGACNWGATMAICGNWHIINSCLVRALWIALVRFPEFPHFDPGHRPSTFHRRA